MAWWKDNKETTISLRMNPKECQALETCKEKFTNIPYNLKPIWSPPSFTNSKTIRAVITLFSKLSQEEIDSLCEKYHKDFIDVL